MPFNFLHQKNLDVIQLLTVTQFLHSQLALTQLPVQLLTTQSTVSFLSAQELQQL
jgi:hypothetical protein